MRVNVSQHPHIDHMATYEIISLSPADFSARITPAGGCVDVRRWFSTEAAALNWVAEMLVQDIAPSREA